LATQSREPQQGEPQVYRVIFHLYGGKTSERLVATHFGAYKAIYIATLALGKRILSREDTLSIAIEEEGPPQLDENGVPVLNGVGIDRNEW
jgi:hypothetical protein